MSWLAPSELRRRREERRVEAEGGGGGVDVVGVIIIEAERPGQREVGSPEEDRLGLEDGGGEVAAVGARKVEEAELCGGGEEMAGGRG